ncbi:AMP-dependent synthetase and ligase [Calothrix sp. NIES-4071]|nr:AMP-dependent synthetase and ligase [Calothrix sp. NIES-4071]BAZ61750.1 AMP-dependent synthetase and ligase [Calothrix sp. NIES-4105]
MVKYLAFENFIDELNFDFLFDGLFKNLVENLSAELTSNYCGPAKVIIAFRNPVKFLAGFLAACQAKCQVFLCNPDWGDNEWRQVLDLVQPDVIWGERKKAEILNTSPSSYSALVQTRLIASLHSALIMIPTGGSSGQVKFAVHTWETLIASVQGFTEYFQINQVNSVCLLPLYHVSGLMQFIRAFTTGGKLAIWNFKQLLSGEVPDIDLSNFFISLVPTQLQRFLDDPQLTIWLSKFNTVLLGGAPAWDDLLEKARYHKIRLAPTYGMTETASQIVTLKPNDFLSGKRGCGQVLPHARVLICDDNNKLLPANQIGKITIQAQSLFLGYYSEHDSLSTTHSSLSTFKIDDVGYFDEEGYLNIVGRDSSKIITGGENVYPEEVEAAIQATEMVNDICVVGIPDKYWGQVVTAVYVPKYPNTSTFAIQTLLKYSLSKYKIPKHWVSVAVLPRNPQGKINRNQIQRIAIEYIYPHSINHNTV